MLVNVDWNGSLFAWLIAIILVALYYAKLRHKLTSELRWFMEIYLLTILGLLFMNSLTLHPTYSNPNISTTWNFDGENNIPAYTSTILLFSISFVASRLTFAPIGYLKRMFWLIFAFTFFLFALDEQLRIHEYFYDLYDIIYPILVTFSILIILILHRHSKKAERESLSWLLWGLFMSIIGAYYFDQKVELSLNIPVILPSLQIDLHSAEELLEFFGILFILLGLLRYSRKHIKGWANTHHFRQYLVLLPILAVIFVRYLSWLEPFHDLKVFAEPVNVVVDEVAIALQGADLPKWNQLNLGTSNHILIHTYYQANRPPQQNFGFSLHLLDQVSEEIYTSNNHRNFRPLDQIVVGRTYRIEQKLPEFGSVPPNRAIWLVFSLWYEDEYGEFHNYIISESDQRLLSERQAILTEFVVRTEAEPSSGPAIATFENGFDLRKAEMPHQANLGETLNVAFTWSSANDGTEDAVQFLHFHHEESDTIWHHDQPPLGARLPTRLWYTGLEDREAWQIDLPDDLPTGRYQLYTGLYRSIDTERITAYDESGNEFQDAIIPLGTIEILN